jgi:hypothetical protein
MLPLAVVAHSARGRTRFKIPARRRDVQYFATVEQRLPNAPDVEGVQTNPITGSVLVHHWGPAEALYTYAEQNELFCVSTLPDRASNLMRQRGRSFDQQLREFTSGYLDVRSLTFITLVSIGLVQSLRGQFAGPALAIFWYAATLVDESDGDPNTE